MVLQDYEAKLFFPEFTKNPCTSYTQLREQIPVHQVRSGWLVTRYEDVEAVLRPVLSVKNLFL